MLEPRPVPPGLIGALMFSVAVGLPTCFDFNEVEEAIARFSEADTVHGGAYWAAADVWTGHFQNWGWWNWTTKQMTMASVMLGSSVLTVILIYLSLTATTFKDPLKRDSPVLLKKWWDWTKFGIMYAFGNLIIGTVSLFNSIQGLYFLKVLRAVSRWWVRAGRASRAALGRAPLSRRGRPCDLFLGDRAPLPHPPLRPAMPAIFLPLHSLVVAVVAAAVVVAAVVVIVVAVVVVVSLSNLFCFEPCLAVSSRLFRSFPTTTSSGSASTPATGATRPTRRRRTTTRCRSAT